MTKSKLVLLLMLYLCFISLGLPDQAFGVAWPDMRRYFAQPLDAGGLVVFLLAMMSAGSSFCSGWLRRRYSIARIVIVSTLLTVIGIAGFALSTTWPLLLCLVIPYGLGAGAIDASLNDYVAKNYSSRQMNWLHSCWGIGAALGPAIMTVAITRFTWQDGYWFIALLQCLLLLLFVAGRRLWQYSRRPTAPVADASPELSGSLWAPAPLLSAAFFFVYTAVEFSLSVWFYSVMVEYYRTPAALAGSVVVAYWSALMCGRFLVGLISDKVGNRWIISRGIILAFIGIFFLFSPSPLMLFTGVILAGLGYAGLYPSMMHETPHRFDSLLATAVTGVQAAMAALGVALLAPLIGVLISRTSLAWFLPCALMLTALLALLNHRLNART